jgi:Tol biopolymer transport system component
VQGIHLVDTTGRYVRLVKEGEGIGVAWSPDAQWLAYAAQQNLFMVRVTGDSSVQLTIRSGAIRPAWSPKRDTIAFVRTGIWLIDLKTREEWELSTTGNFPSWLPDGSGVVVLTSLSAIRGIQYSFEVCDLVSRQLTTLYEFLSASSCGFCSINSRGDAIVFSAKAYDAFAEVWVVDLVSRTPKRLTDDGGDYPAWSPDARSIVYTRTQPGDGGLWIMDADGANKRRLTAPD